MQGLTIGQELRIREHSANRTSVTLVPQEHHRRKGERTEELEDGEEAHKGSLLTCCGYCPREPGSAHGAAV